MAKELPYFKFEPNQWENGNIQICNREDKGLFIDLCSMYWSRLGDLPLKLAIQRLCNGNVTAFDSLIEESIFKVIDGQVCIDFLNEQLVGFENLSSTNSENARIGWEKRRKNATALQPQSESDAIREDKSKEDKIKENKVIGGGVDFESLMLYWNKSFENKLIPKIDKITPKRKKAVNAIVKEFGKEKIKESVSIILNNPFFDGKSDTGWILTFDWLFIIGNFTKVIEGNYNRIKPDKSKAIY